MNRYLVLGGGGPVGASWMSALVGGLTAAGLPLAESDVVMGTSAGSVVGAWLTIQVDGLSSVPERMRARAAWHAGKAKAGNGNKDMLQRLGKPSGDSVRSVAQAAVAATPPISADEAEAMWRPGLPEGKWPQQLRIAAVNADTGDAHAWSAEDDIPLGVAVACSTAAPGAAPPVMVAGAPWVDGGVRSGTNADLAVGDAGKVLIVAPLPSDAIAREEAILVGLGHDVRVIVAERFYQKPLDLLDAHFIDAAVEAGERQARAVAADLGQWWSR